MRVLLASLITALGLVPCAAASAAPQPTRERPIVVGSSAISLSQLERWTERFRAWYVEREMSRTAAAELLVGRASLRNEARRRGIRPRGRKAGALEHAVARAITGRVRDPATFVRRFRAYDTRWRRVTRCTPYWSVVDACLPPSEDYYPTLWAGATDILAVLDPDPPEKPFWIVSVVPERFGVDSDRNGRLLRRISATIRGVPGLRRRIGSILNEGEIGVFALDEEAAGRIALELFLLQRRMLG